MLTAVGAAGNTSTKATVSLPTAYATYHAHEVTYLLGGSATSASITYTNSSGNIEQDTNVAVPLTSYANGSTRSVIGLVVHPRSGAVVEFMAQNNTDSGTLECSINYDGTVINAGQASGGYAIVTCSATVP